MTDKKILVIDDSATIRKLVDTHLSPAGYDVTLAPSAEDGLALAQEIVPDLILLDHQLPGTTGFEVAQALVGNPELAMIPVVISSTLRKKAYIEYADLDNVVDMLPKPYTQDLLVTTVANAIETAAMVVASQSKGATVPEIIGDASEPDLSGSLTTIGLRQVIDFLNNGNHRGVLEIEGDRVRYFVYVADGRVQGMSASGISADDVERFVSLLPDSIVNLAEVMKLTIAGRNSAEFDGFMQLLDRRVLDPRLMAKLVRFQAAMLIGDAFERPLTRFQFIANQSFPTLYNEVPLQSSLLALMVENALHCPETQLPSDEPSAVYQRKLVRGQNLDRAGLSARHLKILNLLAKPCTVDELQLRIDWPREEVRRVLHALVRIAILERNEIATTSKFVLYEPSTLIASKIRGELKTQADRFVGKVVRDTLTLQLMIKRMKPDAVFFAIDSPTDCAPICEAMKEIGGDSDSIAKAIFVPQAAINDDRLDWSKLLGFTPDHIGLSPYSIQTLFASMSDLASSETRGTSSTPKPPHAPLAGPKFASLSREVVS